jgi:hypothetical protein
MELLGYFHFLFSSLPAIRELSNNSGDGKGREIEKEGVFPSSFVW